MRRDLAKLGAGQTEQAETVAAVRRTRNTVDIVGSAAVFVLTYLLFLGSPSSGNALLCFVVTAAIGAAAGALTVWLRGGLSAVVAWGAAFVDMLLIGGSGAIFRLLMNGSLLNMITFSRRMDRMEGI